MICEICRVNDATLHYFESIDGRQRTLNLCEGCATSRGNRGEPLAAAGNMPSSGPPPAFLQTCLTCKRRPATYAIGLEPVCTECLEIQRMVAKDIKGFWQRITDRPVQPINRQELQAEMAAAVAREDFVEAARIRDIITLGPKGSAG